MKPFYRILTYLVLIVQSFVILLLLVEKEQGNDSHTVVRAAKHTPPKLSGRNVTCHWELPALPAQWLFFNFHYCKR